LLLKSVLGNGFPVIPVIEMNIAMANKGRIDRNGTGAKFASERVEQ